MDKHRLLFHLMPPQGWMNDPNGLCQFQGVYHVFFQYTPDNPKGGNKSWGHYTSKDLIHWKYQGIPLEPDQNFDKDGVFSGSVFLHEEKMYLYYTGNVEHSGIHDYVHTGREANTILVTSRDGKNFSSKQCILTNEDYPSEYTCHIRDPKVWQQDGMFYMIQGGRLIGDKGAVLIFQSEDLEKWSFFKDITTEYDFGFMWECPDYFSLPMEGENGTRKQGILSLSPQGLEAEEYCYQNIYQSGYFLVGENILENSSLQNFVEWDMGFDFYAPQTFLDEQGRRILIGWAGLADEEYDNKPTIEQGWQHALTVPRVLTWKNGRVYQNPVPELEKLRQEELSLNQGEYFLLERKAYEILLERVKGKDFQINFQQKDSGLCLKYADGVFSLEFYGEKAEEMGRGRKKRQLLLAKLESCRILLDTSLLEIYLNQGEVVMTSRYYIENQVSIENNPFNLRICKGEFQGKLWEWKGFCVK